MSPLKFSSQSARRAWQFASLVLVAFISLPGCWRSDELFRCQAATEAVESALSAWRQRTTADRSVIHQGQVELHDEDALQGAQLLSGSVVRSYIDPDQTVRCVARLVVKLADGRQETKEITYQVVVRDGKTIVAPDSHSRTRVFSPERSHR